MSACLSSGGGASPAAYSFELEKIKSPPSSSTTTRATSPTSTISESSNSPLTISTRKPRTARKRPNQTYNEAVALLSTVYPNIFYAKKKTQFYGFLESPLLDEPSELLLPIESIEEPDFLFHPRSNFFFQQKDVNNCGLVGPEVNRFDISDEFDAESILDEEIGEGIDSIMGNMESNSEENLGMRESKVHGINRTGRLEQMMMMNRKFPLGLGLKSALRENNDRGFQTVDFERISPRVQISTVDEEKEADKKKSGEKSKKKKKKKVSLTESKSVKTSKVEAGEGSGVMLKLDYDGVLEAWSDKGLPFSDEILGSDAVGTDVNARLAQIDLFGDNGMRKASVLRYKEKRRTRLYSDKIRYEVRKLNADQRPRNKGRFVSRPNMSTPNG